jgi:hypothetical protein
MLAHADAEREAGESGVDFAGSSWDASHVSSRADL